jgi:O-acetylserine/cysteine efflux transporter
LGARLWLWLIAAQSVWTGSYVAMKFAGAELPVGAVVTLRYGVAALLFLPLILRHGLPRYEGRDWALIAVLGALNFGVSPTLQVAAVQYSQAVDVSILVALEPLLTLIFAAIFLGEKLSARTWAAGAISLAGALVLSGFGLSMEGAARDRLLGNGLFLSSTLLEISVTIFGARLVKRYDPVVTMGLLKTAGFLASAAAYAGVWGDIELAAISAKAWWSIVFLGAGASVFGYGVWYWLLKRAPVQKLALSLFLQPFVGTVAGVALAGETVGPNTLLGASLILAGLAWSETQRRPPV